MMRWAVASLLALATALASAQAYPTRPIRILVPSTPGGSVDTLARMVSRHLSEKWNQQVVVDNRAGAGGVIAAELAAKASPDGHTLIMGTVASMATNVSLTRNLSYHPTRDFDPVTLVAAQQLMLVVNPSVPAESVADLLRLARAKPGQLTFASAGNGSGGHLSGELFRMLTGIDLVHIPYKGVSPAMLDVVSGQVTMSFASIISGTPQVRSGKLRALAVTGLRRSPAQPETPTMIEAGVKGYESSTWYGLLAPKGTPRPIVMKLHQEVVALLQQPATKERLLAEGAEPVGNTPDQFRAFIDAEIAKWGKIIRAAGLTAS
ncbi:MAG: tripartite tricarboxylate transporter substrate binding protein [Pseudomonadota bacterium]